MAEPRAERSPLPAVAYSGRLVRANDRRREIVLAVLTALGWLGGFAAWTALWRYGRWHGGFEGHAIRLFAFGGCAFNVVSMGVIRAWLDRVLCRLGW